MWRLCRSYFVKYYNDFSRSKYFFAAKSALCFAAGAMVIVMVEELIPEPQRSYAHIDLVTMAGFSVMIRDVASG